MTTARELGLSAPQLRALSVLVEQSEPVNQAWLRRQHGVQPRTLYTLASKGLARSSYPTGKIAWEVTAEGRAVSPQPPA
jgi:hypothetical protein